MWASTMATIPVLRGSCVAARTNRALVRVALGRPAVAEPLYGQALEMNQHLYKDDHPKVADCPRNLSGCLSKQVRLPKAQGAARQAADMAARLLPEGHQVRAMCGRSRWQRSRGKCTPRAGAADGRIPPSPSRKANDEQPSPATSQSRAGAAHNGDLRPRAQALTQRRWPRTPWAMRAYRCG